MKVSFILTCLLTTSSVLGAVLLPRATSDICGNIGTRIGSFSVNICLCVSNVDAFISGSTALSTLIRLRIVTVDQVRAILINLITAQGAIAQCTYPDHAAPIRRGIFCDSSNPCGFTCTNGFQVSGNACVCVGDTLSVCNGVCGVFGSCPTTGFGKRSYHHCPKGETACGVHWRGITSGFECLNTQTNLESCGGCVSPSLPSHGRGTDCTSLHGVDDVKCMGGQCIIQSCKRGFQQVFSDDEETSTCVSEEFMPHPGERLYLISIEGFPEHRAPALVFYHLTEEWKKIGLNADDLIRGDQELIKAIEAIRLEKKGLSE